MNPILLTLLLLLTVGFAVHDLRIRRIPNGVTLPLLGIGMLLHLPGNAPLWIACVLLVLAWRVGAYGTGDLKLYLALLWLIPLEHSATAFVLLVLVQFLTGVGQGLYLALRRLPRGTARPAVWRAVPFVLALFFILKAHSRIVSTQHVY